MFEDTVSSSLSCDWTCFNDAVKSCFCVVRNDTNTLTWTWAKQICESDGAYLARIDTQEQNDLIDYEVRLKIPNQDYSTGDGKTMASPGFNFNQP